ncbi:hypothetical protein ACFQRD_09010 [Brachybacterium sp. GCM10030268]|uniref:hypothetical protein n=1 Tax=Brachybacterium sp. GCM10030268 TaxID=3273382 RepID=UPI00361AA634
MDAEIQLISDGDGLAVLGDPAAVDAFLGSAGVESRELPLEKLRATGRNGTAARVGSAAMEVGAVAAVNAGRWVKLTEESARKLQLGTAMKGSTDGVSRALLTENGKISSVLEFAKTPAGMLTNPALLTGAAGIMAQLAMQQTMDEITDYLAAIDEKVEDVLRAQKDAALAEMIGAGFVIDEAMIVRKKLGRVPEVTWSQVQSTAGTIASAQAYALRRLDAVAAKLEGKRTMADIAKAAKQTEPEIREWLAVLARAFQLLDAKDVLELDRVLETTPEDVESHRLALRAARQHRLEKVSSCTVRVLERAESAASTANSRVLLHPGSAKSVVRSSNAVSGDVIEFRSHLGIDAEHDAVTARRWIDAAGDLRDGVRAGVKQTGSAGVDAARRLGGSTAERARSVRGGVSRGIGERLRRGREDSADDE